MTLSLTMDYALSILVFVVTPFAIFVLFSVHLWRKMEPVSEHYKQHRQSKRLPNGCKRIIAHSVLYILFNLANLAVTVYSCVKYSNQLGASKGTTRLSLLTGSPVLTRRQAPDYLRVLFGSVDELLAGLVGTVFVPDSADREQPRSKGTVSPANYQFHLFLLGFQLLNAVSTVLLKTTSKKQTESFYRTTKVLFISFDGCRALLSCLTLYELCRMRSNEDHLRDRPEIFGEDKHELIL